MSNFLNTNFAPAWPIVKDCVVLVSGITALNEILALCLAEANDGILVGMPIYGSFTADLLTKSEYSSNTFLTTTN